MVEDEALFALEEEQILRNFGYDVILELSGEEAIEVVSGSPVIDLVLMDIGLGSGTGGPDVRRGRYSNVVMRPSHSSHPARTGI